MSKPKSNDDMDEEVFRMVNPKQDPQQPSDRSAGNRCRYSEDPKVKRSELAQYVLIGGVLCALGGLYLIGAWRQDVGLTTGGVFIAAGLTLIGIGIARWRWR